MRIILLLLLGLLLSACRKTVLLYLIDKTPVAPPVAGIPSAEPSVIEPPFVPTDELPVPENPIATKTTNARLITFNLREPDRLLNRCYELDNATIGTYGVKFFSRFYKPGNADGPDANTSFTKINDQEYDLVVAHPDEFKCLRANTGAGSRSVAGEAFLTLEIIGIIETGREMLYTVEEENNAGKLSFTLASEMGNIIVDMPGRPIIYGVDLSGTDPHYDISSVAALNSRSPKIWLGRRVYGYKRLLIQNTCGASALKPGEKTAFILRAKDLARPSETQVIRINVILR